MRLEASSGGRRHDLRECCKTLKFTASNDDDAKALADIYSASMYDGVSVAVIAELVKNHVHSRDAEWALRFDKVVPLVDEPFVCPVCHDPRRPEYDDSGLCLICEMNDDEQRMEDRDRG